MSRIKRVVSRVKYAAIGGAVGGAVGGLFSPKAASTGAGFGALVGATIGERWVTVDSAVQKVRGRKPELLGRSRAKTVEVE